MRSPPPMRFFLDEGVLHGIGKLLEEEGFEVIYLEDKTLKGAKDTLIAAVSEANSAILIAFDSDFKSIAQREGIGKRTFRTLSLLRFEKCRESQAPDRLRKALSLIKHEWAYGNEQRDRRMFVVITGNAIRTHR